MFNGCHSLTSIAISQISTKGATTMNNMFLSCYSLTNLDVNNFEGDSLTEMNHIFEKLLFLKKFELS